MHPSGTLSDGGTKRAVVGRFSSSGVLANLERLVIVTPTDTDTPATLVYVLARDAQSVEQLVGQVRALSGLDPELLSLTTSQELVELQDVLSGQVGALARQLALGAIAAGLLLVLLTVTLAVGSRRRDFGRRRALGSTRSALVALVTLETALPIVLGAGLGTVGGAGTVLFWTGTLPDAGFLTAVPILVITIGSLTAIPPACFAAFRDPVSILRVP